MKTVKQVSLLTGVSVRTLHHYDAIGLLNPSRISDSGYRMYDDEAIDRLHKILAYREIGFSLKEITTLLNSPDRERNQALDRQILSMQRRVDQLQNRITFAQGIKLTGEKHMNFHDFDPKKLDDYSAQAKALYGKTEAYREFTEKTKHSTPAELSATGDGLMDIFRRFGAIRAQAPESAEAQALVQELKDYITAHYYTCTNQILRGLGEMYAGGGSMTENIDAAGGAGTGEFARRAIAHFCK